MDMKMEISESVFQSLHRGRRSCQGGCQGLAVYYAKFRALADINLSVHEKKDHRHHRTFGLWQVHLAALLQPHEHLTPGCRVQGDISLDGENIYAPGVDVVDIRRRVGMVFQRPNPFPKSIYDNVAYGPRLYGIRRKADLDEIVEKNPSGRRRCGMTVQRQTPTGPAEPLRRAAAAVCVSACPGR